MKKINIKESVKNNVSSIAEFHTQAIETLGLVKDSNQKDNTCTVLYRTFDNKVVIRPNVTVRLQNPNIIDWFPKKDDYVLIKETGGIPIILGDGNQIFKDNTRDAARFKKNIFSQVSDVTGGFLI